MPYSVSTRPLTDEERESLRQSSRFSLDDWAWIVVGAPSLGVMGYLFGRAIEWGFAKVGLVIAPFPSILLAVCGAMLGLYVSFAVFQAIWARARSAAIDLRNGLLHVITVQSDSVVQQQEFNYEGPIYFFDLGDDRILLLWGQWLYDPYVVSVGEDQTDASNAPDDEEVAQFPSTRFVLHRTPALGRVLRLEVAGNPMRELYPKVVDELS